MEYDPTKPVEDSPLDAEEMRNQLNALKALIDALTARVQALESGKPSMDDVNAAITANSSTNSNSVDTLDLNPSGPPTQYEVYETIYRLNVLIGALRRQG